ncbi:hypothetical protein [Arenimonas daejeonensis]|nr:hypothetical protein [Arenimonas daejeonensis]
MKMKQTWLALAILVAVSPAAGAAKLALVGGTWWTARCTNRSGTA